MRVNMLYEENEDSGDFSWKTKQKSIQKKIKQENKTISQNILRAHAKAMSRSTSTPKFLLHKSVDLSESDKYEKELSRGISDSLREPADVLNTPRIRSRSPKHKPGYGQKRYNPGASFVGLCGRKSMVIIGVIIFVLCLASNYRMWDYTDDWSNSHNPSRISRHSNDLIYSLQTSLDEANARIVRLNNALRNGNSGEMSPSVSSITEEYRKNRIYCMIPTMWAKRKFAAWSAVLQTWGKNCDVIKFFVDPLEGPVDNPETGKPKLKKIPKVFVDKESGHSADIVVVPMVRKNDPVGENGKPLTKSCWSGGGRDENGNVKYVACRHIWEKVWRSWVYVGENDLDTAEWFFKIDDDTMFFPQNARRFVLEKKWSHEDTHYFGHLLHYKRDHTFISGVMVGLSRRTLELAKDKYNSMEHEYGDRAKFKHGRCVDRDGATQEVTESICLRELGIRAETANDIHGFEKVALQDIAEAMVFRKREGTSYWLWTKRPKTAIFGSIEPLAFHPFKKPSSLKNIHRRLFDRSHTELRDKFVDRDFVSRVYEKPGAHNTMGGGGLGKYSELQYLLSVREMLGVNGFFDEMYDNMAEG